MLKALFTYNRWQKIFSLLLASLIWFAVRTGIGLNLRVDDVGRDGRRFAGLPITVLTTASDLGRYQVVPATVTLVLRGDPEVLKDLAPADIEVYVNLVEPGPGRSTRPIHFHAPAGTEVVTINPVEVQIERITNALLPPTN